MIIAREKHCRFLEDELKAEAENFNDKFNSLARSLLEEKGEMFVAIFEAFHANGSMVMKFPTKRPLPRKGMHYMCMLLPKELRPHRSWGDKTYRDLFKVRCKGTDCKCVYFGKLDGDFAIVGFRGVSVDFKDEINDAKGIALVFAPQYPPLEYVTNLYNVVKNTESKGVSEILDADYTPHEWKPILLKDNAAKTVLSQMQSAPTVILQGPPGTGKTFAIAQICAELCAAGKSVLITALTNRALIEVASKPALAELLEAGKVSKMNLSVDEGREVKGLLAAGAINPIRGKILLSTFYCASKGAAENADDGSFDVVIMDEASQAYLGMFAAARKMGKSNLWVGDINQLAPVVELNADRVAASNYEDIIDGFKQLSTLRNYPVMQMTKTYRLAERATTFTGIFYNNTLVSAHIEVPLRLKCLDEIANTAGGPTIIFEDLPVGDPAPQKGIAAIAKMTKAILNEAPKKSIAVLAHKTKTVSALQKAIAFEIGGKGDVIVETVARIQGLTTDITIFLIPNTGYHYGLERRLFNVATSRAKEHTIIIASKAILDNAGTDADVRKFLQKLVGDESKVKTLDKTHLSADEASSVLPEKKADNVPAQQGESSLSAPASNSTPLNVGTVRDRRDEVQAILALWLMCALKGIWKEGFWEKGVLDKLSDEQRKNAADDGAKGLDQIDFASLISVFIGNFSLLRQNYHVRSQMFDMAKHIKTIRNNDAHKSARSIMRPNQKELQYDLDTLNRFVDGLNASDMKVPTA